MSAVGTNPRARRPAVGHRAIALTQPAAAAGPLDRPIMVTGLGVLCFIAGSLSHWRINLVGEIFIGEFVLLLVALAAAASGGLARAAKVPVFWLLIVLTVVTLGGYMMSDMIRETPQEQYLRGWARAGVLLTSFVALALAFAADRRTLWWFIAGFGIGGLLWFRLVEGLPLRSPAAWKFGYAVPLTLLLATTAAFLPARIVAIAFGVLGVWSIGMDFRIHGAICLLVGALLWLRTTPALARQLDGARLAALALAGGLALVGVSAVIEHYSTDWHDQRRQASNLTRLAGVKYGVMAVKESPVIGYGSWSTSPELRRIAAEAITAAEEATGAHWGMERRDVNFHTHSIILQAWVEGGLLGASLFLVLLWLTGRRLLSAITDATSDPLKAAILFLLLFQVWNLLQSPLGAIIRMQVALSMAVLVLLALDALRRHRAAGRAPLPRSLTVAERRTAAGVARR